MESCFLGAGEILRLLFSPNTVDKQMITVCVYIVVYRHTGILLQTLTATDKVITCHLYELEKAGIQSM